MPGEKYLFKKGWLVLVTILLVFVISFSGCAIADEIKNPLAVDMVIVIDNNIFMNHHATRDNRLDPDGLRFDAAAALIGMCDAQYSRAAYFMFSDDLYAYTERTSGHVQKIKAEDIAFFNISLPKNRPQRQNLMNTLNGDNIRNGYGTKRGVEIGKALSAAVDVEIKNQDNGNRKVILLLSSGSKDISSESASVARQAKERAMENGIEIYTVALKESTNAKLLQDLATKPTNYQFVANVEDLIDVYRTFFADMIGSNPSHTGPAVRLEDGTKEISLKIPNESVSEVNLIIPLKKMEGLELIGPDGKAIKSTDDSILINQSRNFCTYKLVDPKADTYYLRYSSKEERDIVIQYVFSYSVQAVAGVESQKISKHQPVTVTARYIDNGVPTKDLRLYEIPAKVTLWKGDKLIVPEQPMPLNANGNGYAIEYSGLKQYGAGEYTAKIVFDGAGLLRESEVSFTLLNDNPSLIRNGEAYNVTINEPKKAETYDVVQHKKQWDLNTFVEDVNGDDLVAEVISSPENTDVHCNGMTLSVMPKKNMSADGNIVVVISDIEGGKSGDLIFPVKIANYEDRYKDYVARFDDPADKLKKNSSQKLILKVYNKDGAVVKDKEHLPETVTAMVKTGTAQREVVLSITDDGCWEGEFKTDNIATDYEADADIKISEQVKITAEKRSMSSVNLKPELRANVKPLENWIVQINDPGDSSSYDVKNRTWTLTDFVVDPDGDDITFEVDQEASIKDVVVSYNKESKEFTLTTKKDQEAKGNIVVHCWDNEHLAGPDLTFHVEVSSVEEIYRKYTAKLEIDGRGKNKDVTITLSVYDDDYDDKGMIVQKDSNMPETVDASYILDATQTALPLTRGTDGKWSGTFHTADKEVIYTVKAAVPISKNIKIQPKDLQFSTENRAPEVVKEIAQDGKIPQIINIEPFLFWNQETGEIIFEDLNKFFTDPDGDTLAFDFGDKDLGDNVDATIEGNKLSIRGLKETSNLLGFTVRATDNEGLFAESQKVQFTVKSKKNEGIKTIILVVAALIALIILYNIFKPGFHNQYFDVTTKREGGVELTQGRSGVLKGKKSVRLGSYSTANAKSFCGTSLSVSALNNVELSPAYGNRVKIKTNDKTTAVKIGSNRIDSKKGGVLSPEGVLTVEQNGIAIMFKLKRAGANQPARVAAPAPGARNNNATPGQRPSQTKRTGRT